MSRQHVVRVREHDATCTGCAWRVKGNVQEVEGAAEAHAFDNQGRIELGWQR